MIGEEEFKVVDISERGVKFITDHPDQFSSGLKEVRARIIFPDRSTREIRGAILRIERCEVTSSAQVIIFLYEGWGISRQWIEREIDRERRNKDGS
jgi:hypothetical protein